MALWTPANLAVAPAFWIDATNRASVTVDGDNFISQINDLSGNGRHFTAAGTERPFNDTSSLSSTYCLDFDGNDRMLTTWSHTGSGLGLFAVTRLKGTSGWQRIISCAVSGQWDWDSGDRTSISHSGATSGTWASDRNASFSTSATVAGDTPNSHANIVAVVYDGSGGQCYYAGNAGTASTTSGAFNFNLIGLGQQAGRNDDYLNGYIGEALALGYAPTTTERQQIEGYLAWKWGRDADLPSGHPYKSAAPTTGGGTAYTLTAAQGTYALTGQSANLPRGRTIIAAQGAYTQTGIAANLVRGRTIVAAQGSYALSGVAANLISARTMAAAQGSYALTGVAANLNYSAGAQSYMLTAAQGSYSLTGQDATFPFGRVVTAAKGTYTQAGVDAALFSSRTMAAGQGTYAAAGYDAGLTRGYALIASAGGYALTGRDADLASSRTMPASVGGYAASGQVAALRSARSITAGQGAYLLSGVDATLRVAYVLRADSGSYALTGINAGLVKQSAGAFVLAALPGAYASEGQNAAFRVALSLRVEAGVYTVVGNDADLRTGTTPEPVEETPIVIDGRGRDRARKHFEETQDRNARALREIIERAFEEDVEQEPSTPAVERHAAIVDRVRYDVDVSGLNASFQEILRLVAEYEQLIAWQRDEEEAVLLLLAA